MDGGPDDAAGAAAGEPLNMMLRARMLIKCAMLMLRATAVTHMMIVAIALVMAVIMLCLSVMYAVTLSVSLCVWCISKGAYLNLLQAQAPGSG